MAWDNLPTGFADVVEKTLSDRQREMVIYALQRLIQHSPVDTGAYRGSHFVTLHSPDTSSVPKHSPGEAERLAEMALRADTQPFKAVYVQSNIVYGERIEAGHSQQAPAGVYAIATNSTRERFSR